jgi:hypothetical protein
MMVDLAEISGLADPARHVRRCTESGLVYLEVLTIAICAILPIMVILAVESLGRPLCPHSQSQEACDSAEKNLRREVDLYVFLSWILPVTLA